jgi:hypothetical protein
MSPEKFSPTWILTSAGPSSGDSLHAWERPINTDRVSV